jgi:hypothetical protein
MELLRLDKVVTNGNIKINSKSKIRYKIPIIQYNISNLILALLCIGSNPHS